MMEHSEIETNKPIISTTIDLDCTKPPTDKKKYRLLELENGLEVMLVSDPEKEDTEDAEMMSDEESQFSDEEGEESDENMEDEEESEEEEDADGEEMENGEGGKGAGAQKKAAAAMSVNVGSFTDPKTVQGLAHFLEHMLFMGSEKYPTENAYDAFISKNGGYTNAYTEFEHTVYFFDVVPSALQHALDIFAQFFISPLMLEDATDRELNSIESEFSLVLNSDGCRFQQLFCHLAREGNPYKCFSWGNLRSLKEEPGSAGVDTRAALQSFYCKHYIAPAMRLCVLGTQSLDELESYVKESFSPISAVSMENSVEVPLELVSYDGAVGPFTEMVKGSVFKIVPVKDIHQLYLSWVLPSQIPHYKSKPAEYLGHLIGHEGEGSILSILKEKGWATGISAGVGASCFENNTACSIFSVLVYATEEGTQNWQSIVLFVMQYLALLRKEGPQEWVFKELQDIAAMQYQFREESDPDDYVTSLAVQMLPQFQVDKIDYLRAESLFQIWDPETITQFLQLLVPQDMRIDLMSKLLSPQASESDLQESTQPLRPNEAPEVEPYFGTEYWHEKIPQEQMTEWGNPECNDALSLPQPNPFIPSDFSLCNRESSQKNDEEESKNDTNGNDVGPEGFPPLPNPPPLSPKLLVDTPLIKAWHLQDEKFLVPKAEVYLKLVCPTVNRTPRNAAICELLVCLIKDSLNEYTYMAQVSELNYSLKRIDLGFELKVSGFSHKLCVLLQATLNRLLNMSSGNHLMASRFLVQKEALLRSYKNLHMKPGSQATNLRVQMLKDQAWSTSQKETELLNTSMEDLVAFVPTLFSQIHSEVLMHGNIDEAGANALCETIRTELDSASTVQFEMEAYPEQKVVHLDSEKHFIYCCPSKDPTEKNSALVVYWQTHEDNLRDRLLLDVIEYLMDEPIYDTLRTKEQLGYSVSCSSRLTNGVGGFSIKVQSASHSPSHIYGRILAFLENFQKYLLGLSQEAFVENLISLAKAKLQKDMCIAEEASRHWYEILERRYQFNGNITEALELKALDKNEVVEAFQKWLGVDSHQQKQLVVVVVGGFSSFKSKDSVESECSFQVSTIQQMLEENNAPGSQDKERDINANDSKFCVLSEPQALRHLGVFYPNLV